MMRRRLRFLSLTALALPTLAGATVLMSGCGGNQTTAQSTVQGAYTGVWDGYSAPEAESGVLTFSVDSHGKMTGAFTAKGGAVSLLDATMLNNGNFSGSINRAANAATGATAQSYAVSGRFFNQQVDQTAISAEIAAFQTTTATPTPSPSGTTSDTYKSGLAGDFRETIDGVEYAGSFQAIGGPTTT